MADTQDLIVKLSMENGQYRSAVQKADKDNQKLSKSTTKNESMVKRLRLGYIALAGVFTGVLAKAIGSFIKKAADFEQLNVAFTTMLGSAEKAKKLLGDLEQFSIVTPFTIDQVNKAGKTLLAFGFAGDEVKDTLKILGDVSAGTGKDLSEMAVIFAQIRGAGRLMGQDLLQLINAGFSPLQEISERTGRSMADLKKDMEKGLISFDMVKESFTNVTSEGGKFFNLMSKQSKTFSGRLSTLQGNLSLLGRAIGERLLPVAKQFVTALNDLLTGTSKSDIAAREYQEALDNVAKQQIELNKIQKEYKKGTDEVTLSTVKIAEAELKLSNSKLRDKREELNKTTIKLRNSLVLGAGEQKTALEVEKQTIQAIDDKTSLLKQLKEQQDNLKVSLSFLTSASKDDNRVLARKELTQRKLNSVTNQLLVTEKELADEVDYLNKQQKFGNEIKTKQAELARNQSILNVKESEELERLVAKYNELADAHEKTQKGVKKTGTAFSSLGPKIKSVVDSVSSYVSSIGNDIQMVAGLFKSIADQSVSDIERERDAFLLANEAKIEALNEETAAKLKAIDDELQATLEANGLAEESNVEKLQRELDEAIEAGDKETADIKRQELQRAVLLQEAEDKKAEIKQNSDMVEAELMKKKEDREDELNQRIKEAKKKAWEAEQAAKITQSIMNIAQGISSVWAQWGSYPYVAAALSAVVGSIGAAQTGIIASQKVPQFEQGGIISGLSGQAPGNEDGIIAAQNGEAVLNRQATAVLGEDAINALNSGLGIEVTPNIYINGGNTQDIVDTLNDYFKQFGGGQQLGFG